MIAISSKRGTGKLALCLWFVCVCEAECARPLPLLPLLSLFNNYIDTDILLYTPPLAPCQSLHRGVGSNQHVTFPCLQKKNHEVQVIRPTQVSAIFETRPAQVQLCLYRLEQKPPMILAEAQHCP